MGEELARPRIKHCYRVTAVGVAVALASCSPTSTSPSPSSPPVSGGTLTLGVWQAPSSFLDAGVVAGLPDAYVTDAPVQEGLLWYRSVAETKTAHSPADYWAADLAIEVPTLANGDVKTSGCSNPLAMMCVTWKLRQGVHWHDGGSFSAHDVCATFQLYWLKYGVTGQANPSPVYASAGWNQVIKCSESDRYTAVVDFSSQYGPYLALGSGVYGILPASLLDQAFARGVSIANVSSALDLTRGSGNADAFRGDATPDRVLDGTGPFVFQAYTPGRSVVLVKNRDYWNSAATPHLEKLVFKFEPDAATELKDAQSGAIDVAFDLRLDNLSALIQAAAGPRAILKVQTIPAAGAEKIDLNLCAGDGGLCDNPGAQKNPYTADATVRKAMLLGIDRQAIAHAVAPGLTVVPKDSYMYLGASYLDDPSLTQTRFDPRAAENLLDSAGDARDPKCGSAANGRPYRRWTDGSCLVISLGTAGDSMSRVTVEGMVQRNLQAIGINVPSPFSPNVPETDLLSPFADGGPLYRHAYAAVMYALALGLPGEPDAYFATYHGDCAAMCPERSQVPSSANDGRGMNVTGVSDAPLDMALESGRSTADPAQRVPAYVQAEQRLAAIVPEIPLFQQLVIDSYSVRLQGLKGNDVVWDYNTADWFCLPGSDGKGSCQA